MSQPILSVIIPVYNAEKYLQETINSILNQSFTDYELIILNDKSTDNSKAIIEKNAAADSRIVFVDKIENIGPARLRNEGFETAKGEFIALMDADDIAMPDRFAKQLQFLKENPEVGVCGTFYTLFKMDGKRKLIALPTEHLAIRTAFLFYDPVGNPTIMLRKAVLNDFRFDDDFVPIEDYELWDRMSAHTQMANISESLLDYRWHDTNISQTKIHNVNRALRNLRLAQLQRDFGITPENTNIEGYLNAFNFKRGLSAQEVIATIDASQQLIAKNRESRIFDQKILEKQMNQIVVRTVRKSKEFNKPLLQYLRNEGKPIFRKVRWFDRILITLKSIF
ncbi:glycosyltransferase family 2 protein [Flavobacterium supellecticarium]|uniref:Glycosyltransferase family 2 protein n=1 Tax=Flavobacterium supellecticarium TaxID=2565924 RepID=A0A4S4A002_9FLAO|nr:glycosyltransferase family 2 protein [Flavobacterium supellecticarium]THF51608.1 glycosyltransferase family 2 protein [Flavobacterium supellecticarium]